MALEWNNENIIKFLELLETERVIWDVRDKNHKLKHKVHAAWKKISAAFQNTPIKKLKSKKKSLMATFRPLLKRKNNSIQSGASTDDIYQPIWFAFDIMERFLGPTFTAENTMNTKEQLVQDNNTPSIQTNESDAMPPRSPLPVDTESSEAPKTNMKKSQLYNIITEVDQKINDSFATLSSILDKKKVEEDECDVYAKLLAKRLRKYPGRMRDKIMYKIDGLLLDNPYPDERPSNASTSHSSYM